MLKNYITTAIRNLLRNRIFSAINIGGLALGLASVILIFLFVRDEMGHDSFWADADNIYRMEVEITISGRLPETFAVVAAPIKDALLKDYSEIRQVTRITGFGTTVENGNIKYLDRVTLADRNFFEIFDFFFEEGSKDKALADTNSVVLSKKMATKYFGDEAALGKTLTIDMNGKVRSFLVSGVFADLPRNSHFDLDIMVLLNRQDFINADGSTFLDSWGNTTTYTYIRFDPSADIEAIDAGLDVFTDRNEPDAAKYGFEGKMSDVYGHYLTNIQDIYLEGPQSGRMTAGGDMATVQSFIAIAGLILVISALNFINLSTARSVLRSKEISLRKVMGAERRDIIYQFLGETLVVISMALVIALVIVELALPTFNAFIANFIEMRFMSDPLFLVGLAGLMTVTAIGAGFYPSLVISSFRPVDALGSRRVGTSFSGRLRSFFVVLQFSVSIALIIAATVIYQQTKYASSMELGYQTDNIMLLAGVSSDNVMPYRETLTDQLLAHPDIQSVGTTSAAPFDVRNSFGAIYTPGESDGPAHTVNFRFVDDSHFSTYGVTMIEGRDFDENRSADRTPARNDDGSLPAQYESAVVINQAAVSHLGFTSADDAIGQPLRWGDDGRVLNVIGVIPDIHIMPITYTDEPMVYVWYPEFARVMSIRFSTSDLAGLSNDVEEIWNRVIPDTPIRLSYLSERIESAYREAEARGRMLAVFSVLAILISMLGLYGLASFDTQRRGLEVGIRKVMGASVGDILRLFVWQFSQPVLLANLIAWPVAWLLMSNWLQGFAFRIDLSFHYFVAAGSATLLFAWATVGIHATVAARANPIHALRHE